MHSEQHESHEQPESIDRGQEEALRERFPMGAKVKIKRHSGVLEDDWEVIMYVRNMKNELCAKVYNKDGNKSKAVPLAELAENN